MANSMPNTFQYKTPEHEPQCVHFWERELINTPLWFNWIILKTHLNAEKCRLIQSESCTYEEASDLIWFDFIEATCGVKNSIARKLYSQFLRKIDGYHFAYWIPRLTIGSDIFDGFSEQQARKRYGKWLDDDPENPIFGQYRVTKSLRIVPLKRGGGNAK